MARTTSSPVAAPGAAAALALLALLLAAAMPAARAQPARCPAGAGGAGCAPCPQGAWSRGGTAADPFKACSPCRGGRTTKDAGATRPSACSVIVCKPGRGGASCAVCPAGQWSAGGNATAPKPPCTPCPGGQTTPSAGATDASACGCADTTQELFGGACAPACAAPSVRDNSTGACRPPMTDGGCGPTLELFGGACVPACAAPSIRDNSTGACQPPAAESLSVSAAAACGLNADRNPATGQCQCRAQNVDVGGGNCCRPNSVVVSGACQCKPGFTWDERQGFCVGPSGGGGGGGGQKCGLNADRNPATGQCQCRAQNVDVGGGNCCRPGSEVVNGACQCKAGFVWNPAQGACICSSGQCGGGGPCGLNADRNPATGQCQCRAQNVDVGGGNCCRPGSEVVNGMCQCKGGFVWSPAQGACICSSGQCGGGGPCGLNADRNPATGQCQCRAQNVDVGGGNCCRPGSEVVNGKCQCKAGFTWDERQGACTNGGPTPPPPPPGTGSSFGAANSFYLHALRDGDRAQVLDAMRDAGFKAVRIFIAPFWENEKGSGNPKTPDIENPVGSYNNVQMDMINRLMAEAAQRGLKLIITMHDRYMLGTWKRDAYVDKYNPPIDPNVNGNADANDLRAFYNDPIAAADMDRRFSFIVNYRNPLMGGRAWKDITEAILAFDIQNESEGHGPSMYSNRNWICDRAKKVRPQVNRGILIGTGGGIGIDDSIISEFFACPGLDLIGLHSYDSASSWSGRLQSIVATARASGKRLIFEEFGAAGGDRAGSLREQISAINRAGIPWAVWEVVKPNNPGDFEVWTDDAATWGVLASGARAAAAGGGAFAWPEIRR